MNASPLSLDHRLLLGRYRVVHLLGEGGMGTVYLARVEGAEGFRRPVVVKRMKRSAGSNEEANRLFIREAKILSKLQHPGIVGISDFGIEEGAHVMVLEYVHGYTLSVWLEYRRKNSALLPVDVCLFIVRRVLDALHYAHHFDTEEGHEIEIVHRDVSPDNVLLGNKGYVHLLDFGVASMRGPQGPKTSDSEFRGKLCYSAPETVEGSPATPRSDQYSAAVMLLELLTLSTPFQANSIAETFVKMVQEVPAPASSARADIPAGLDEVLARALSKKPGARFETAHAFARELKRFQREDDEDVAQQLKNLAREEFDRLPSVTGVEPLKVRETALERVLADGPAVVSGEAPGTHHSGERPSAAYAWFEPTVLAGSGLGLQSPRPPLPSEHSTDHAVPPARGALVSSASPATQSQLHRLLWGLLFVGGLIAVGLGAAVALLSRSGSEQVVVVGSELPEPTGEATPSPNDTMAADLALGVSTAPGETPAPVPPASAPNLRRTASEGASLQESNAASVKPETQGAEARISRAVHQHTTAFQACFAKAVDVAESTPEVILHFAVDKEGGPAQVKVEPARVSSAPLGACLHGAAARIDFPRLEQPVTFTVPVRARVTRSEASR